MDEVATVRSRLEYWLQELELLEEQLSQTDLTLQDAKGAIPQLERLQEEYCTIVGLLGGLGAPIEKDTRFSVIKRLSAARSKASQQRPIALSAPSGGHAAGQPVFAGILMKLPPFQSPALLALPSFPAIPTVSVFPSVVQSPAAQTWSYRNTLPVQEKNHIFALDVQGNCIASPMHPLHT